MADDRENVFDLMKVNSGMLTNQSFTPCDKHRGFLSLFWEGYILNFLHKLESFNHL